jgi:transposase
MKTSKQILGLTKNGSEIPLSERHEMIKEYLQGGKKKVEVWYNHTGQTEEHGQLLRWMQKYGYIEKPEISKFAIRMKEKPSTPIDISIENNQLKGKIKELEKSLEMSELKAYAYSTMIDVAEEQLKVSIRKKLNTKQ